MNVGAYAVSEAARIVRIRPERLRAWVRGRATWSGRLGQAYGPVFEAAGEALTFPDLLELRVVKALLDRGATLGNIRAAHNRLSDALNTPYPFIDQSGLKVLDRDVIAPIEHDLLNLTSGQYLIQYVDVYLKDVRFDGGTPVSLKPDGEESAVVIDARVRFGEPTVEGTRIPTADVYDLWTAEGEDHDAVVDAYGLSLQQVLSAIAYEEQRRAPWAA